jgi:rod shape determining protein RodA
MPQTDLKPKRHSSKSVEWPLVLISLVLSGIGIGLIFSATAPMGDAGRSLVLKQMTWCSLGLVLMALFALFDYRFLDQWAGWFYVAVFIALLAVWGLGKVTAGSRRWIELGLIRFQPSEFAKLAVIVILAKYYQNGIGNQEQSLLKFIRPVLLVALPVILVLIQPDLGTAGMIVLIAASMMAVTGLSRRALLWIGGVLVAAIPIMVMLGDKVLLGYQKKRLLTFLNPDSDPLGAGYHIIQSQIAIGSGGFFGKGFLQGSQNQLLFLPVNHTDFIFSILAEEWGFLGCAVVLTLFSALFLRGMAIAGQARDSFGALLAFGCTVALFWHVAINVGMVMGLVPVVGVPLCFLSYGGSSLLMSFICVAILVNVSMRRFSY